MMQAQHYIIILRAGLKPIFTASLGASSENNVITTGLLLTPSPLSKLNSISIILYYSHGYNIHTIHSHIINTSNLIQ